MLRRFESARNRWAAQAMVTAAIGILMIAVAGGVQPPATAQTEGTGRVCSNVTLYGDYGLLGVGQRAVPPFLGGGIEKFVATAMTTFHGNGTFVIQRTGAGLHGEVTGIDPVVADILGTYEVNSNCTGTMQWQPPAPVPPIVHSFVIVDNGRLVKSAVMSPLPNVTTVEFVRK
jgi:hypothetical protein